MAASTTLLHFLLMLVAGWLQRQQAATIDYLKAENRMLRARLGGQRIIFTDAERRQLAEKARALGRKGLRELGTIVTPETLLRWHRELVARKWTFVERRGPGRPRTREELVALVVRMARENRSWGYRRIVGAISNLGHEVSHQTVAKILKRHDLAPAPERGKRMLWKEFIRSHLETLAAVDFFTAEFWTAGGLTTYYVLVFMRIAPQQINIAGITLAPEGEWIKPPKVRRIWGKDAANACSAASSPSKTRAGPVCAVVVRPPIFITHPSGARLPFKMTRPPVFFSGLSSARTTSCPGVSTASFASSPNERPLGVGRDASTKPPATSR